MKLDSYVPYRHYTRARVKMTTEIRWLKILKDCVFAIDNFCEEKKTKQHPPPIVEIRKFAGIVLQTDCERSLIEAFHSLMANPETIKAMKTGLINKNGTKPIPGRFFLCPFPFQFVTPDTTMTINFQQMCADLNTYARDKKIPDERRLNVCLYIAMTLADSIKHFIISRCTSTMDPDTRSAITSNTKIDQVEIPYGTDHQQAAFKGIVTDALSHPELGPVLEKYMGKSSIGILRGAVNHIDKTTFSRMRDSFDSATRTHSINPIFDALKKTIAGVAGSTHADDGIDAQMQE